MKGHRARFTTKQGFERKGLLSQVYPLHQWFLTFVTRMFLNYNSQKPQPAQLVVKASGSCSPKLLSNPRLRTSGLACCITASIQLKSHQLTSGSWLPVSVAHTETLVFPVLTSYHSRLYHFLSSPWPKAALPCGSF